MKIAIVKVYGSYKSACTLRVLACLAEKEVDFELVEVDLEKGKHKAPEFLTRQPFGQVPAVEDGHFKLFESRAIAKYYANKYENQGSDLLGKTPEERAMVDQWLEVEAHNYNDLVFTIVFQLYILPQMGQTGDPLLAQDCELKLAKVLDIYEARLADSKYLAGDSFTLADLTHLPGTTLMIKEVGMGHLFKDRKNVNAWWEDISSRPAWKKVMKLAF